MDEQLRTVAEPSPEEMAAFRRKTWPWWIDLWVQLVKTKPLATLGLIILTFFLITGVFATWIAPEGVNEAHTERLERIEGMMIVSSGTMVIPGPSIIPFHPFGLDNVGRFGGAIALKAGHKNGVYCFSSEDLGYLDEILAFFGLDAINPAFYLTSMGFTEELGTALTNAGFYQSDFKQTALYGLPAQTLSPPASGIEIESAPLSLSE